MFLEATRVQFGKKMVLVSGLLADCTHSGLTHDFAYHLKAPFWIQRCNESKFQDNHRVQFVTRKTPPSAMIRHFLDGRRGSRYATFVGKNYGQLSYDDDTPSEPFWLLSLMKEGLWALRSLFAFLLEQPSQLKYIEWPSFQNTLKTATLTLVLVVLLIVALSSVDAGLSYLLALLLRRIP